MGAASVKALSLVFWAPFEGDECVNAKREHIKVMWLKWSYPPSRVFLFYLLVVLL